MSVDQQRPYGIFDRENRLLWVGLHSRESAVWSIYLGWPDGEEVAAAKASGLRCSPVTVLERPSVDSVRVRGT